MDPARRMERIGSHLSASAGALAGARDSPDDIVIVDAIRTPITRARKVCLCALLLQHLHSLPTLAVKSNSSCYRGMALPTPSSASRLRLQLSSLFWEHRPQGTIRRFGCLVTTTATYLDTCTPTRLLSAGGDVQLGRVHTPPSIVRRCVRFLFSRKSITTEIGPCRTYSMTRTQTFPYMYAHGSTAVALFLPAWWHTGSLQGHYPRRPSGRGPQRRSRAVRS